ncbi:type II toxin-antitoxin system Phd/YefM family antitoxin [Wenzhouxiangella sp. AB-CW3]|uniref:type II toxin-antitoxin system Phd/YefM family antitoxin n=1 Tax=Wenzhouxiangella sp. AB-CW3 TaxID=2771012 RepID=UPI00168BFBEF|nr:type II toxin-antitoxin system Phd/YefM family antitoxin [Wenzhouxiangella sp. AB-CW3]QOC22062.1 type II toxin-antitoxin system Phd/YefM family antitoxin [Wenzhouxiangella sp. AB-CW3]
MKVFTALEAKNRFGKVIDAAQREPVTVTRQGRPSVVIVSAEEYERRQSRAWRNLLAVMEQTGRYAAEQGLTEEALDQLLADES